MLKKPGDASDRAIFRRPGSARLGGGLISTGCGLISTAAASGAMTATAGESGAGGGAARVAKYQLTAAPAAMAPARLPSQSPERTRLRPRRGPSNEVGASSLFGAP